MTETPQPLTQEGFQAIIDLVVAYTGRECDKTLVETWAAQSAIGRWSYPEAARAIHLWASVRGPHDFLEPSDVTRTLRAIRNKAADTFEAPRIPDGQPNHEYPQWYRSQLAAHINALVQRWAATGEEPPTQLPPGPPPNEIGQRRIAELTAGAFREIPGATPNGEPATTDGMQQRRTALARPCPYCDARPHEPCTRASAGGRVRLNHPHPARAGHADRPSEEAS